MKFTVDLEQILWLFGFIASAWGVVKIVKELKKPSDDLRAMVNRHEELLKQDNDRIKNIEKLVISQEGINKTLDEHTRLLSEHDQRLEEDKQRGNLTLKANMAIINSLLTENEAGGQDKLAETRDEIQEFLVEMQFNR